jgi:hypothetical protein
MRRTSTDRIIFLIKPDHAQAVYRRDLYGQVYELLDCQPVASSSDTVSGVLAASRQIANRPGAVSPAATARRVMPGTPAEVFDLFTIVEPQRRIQFTFTDPTETMTISLLDLAEAGTQLTYSNVGAALTVRAEAVIGVERMLDALESSLADRRR